MSSWLGGSHSMIQKKRQDGYFFESRPLGFCSLFLNLFYCWLHARDTKMKLYFKETPNPVSLNYKLYTKTFLLPDTIIPVQEKHTSSLITIDNVQKYVSTRISFYTNEQLQDLAQGFFKFTQAMKDQMKDWKESQPLTLPQTIHAGIHIRSGDKITYGEMQSIPMKSYLDELNRMLSGIDAPVIFVMTDNYTLLQELQTISPASWKYITYTDKSQNGHVQAEFNLMDFKKREQGYIQFLVELEIMRQLPRLIITYTSNIGRYLFLMKRKDTEVVSLDMKVFSPI
jgi:hypothetical protein